MSLASIALWVVPALLPLSSHGQENDAPREMSRILDVQLLEYGDKKYRIIIELSDMAAYSVSRPKPDQPLQVELARTGVDAGLNLVDTSNRLIRDIEIDSGPGQATVLAFPLRTSQVLTKVAEFPSEKLITIDLQLLPGIALPEISEDDSTDFPPLLPTLPPMDGSGPAELDIERTGSMAMPPVRETPRRDFRSRIEDVEAARPRQEDLPPALPPPDQDEDDFDVERQRRLKKFGLSLEFPKAAEMVQAREDGDLLKALDIGYEALIFRQSPESMDSLLFLLAEIRYELARFRSLESTEEEPDWASVLNHYRQALRFNPDTRFRPMIEYKISRIYGFMGRDQERLAMLLELKDSESLPNQPEIIYETGDVAMEIYKNNPADTFFLDVAQDAYQQFVDEFPGLEQRISATMKLAESWYQQGNDQMAYDILYALFQELQGQEFPFYEEILAHYALAAHRLGKQDLVTRQSAFEQNLYNRLRATSYPDIRMEFAQILREGGAREEALREYFNIANLSQNATAEQKFQARKAMTDIRLEDEKRGEVSETVFYDSYVKPVDTLKQLRANTFALNRRMELLRDIIEHLRIQGRDVEAIRMVLPLLEKERLPEDMATELAESIWDVMPSAMERAAEEGDYEFALMVYESFGEYLERHPQKDDLLLEVARILIEAGLRKHAERALERMSPYPALTPDQQSQRVLLSRELEMDPNDPEQVKQLAPDMLHPEYDDRARARVIRLLAGVYRDEGNHTQAAETYMRGVRLNKLAWEDRIGFYDLAAQEYEKVPNYPKVIEVSRLAIQDFENTGVALSDAPDLIGTMLMRLGHSYRQMDEPENALRAFEQYVRNYPEGTLASAARYFLAQSYLENGQSQKALELFEELANRPDAEIFWKNTADKSAKQLRWESDKPYLTKETSTP